ncbi:protein-glutamate O-methyltransferase CheR [Sinorhizobium medicae]|uniref:Protein-glutamate O-methyltransferase n=2 Tax=Sinorhizobium medicae TaxID=110321 RepID=A6UJR2_SINMW|nr:protein-glutamate O-methyltransferase CheR [Sinorhizobium medicae]ABR63892.1 Protein-glutamate O-methyltransferase [Sinorhizobium medicae WSM419]MBO1945273.1 protein-glutamate O-methyltransferase CheR [Sinorhizobium medicae]MDX0404933.1 protein-glutamate O-methyltransferase CheR [Sinorhizobium medicae]MDX0411926.1 protein-glutamate O-methyltransferase CheR [Sinorhizobium medicae]MDX0416757.1 protein-glutamate O-methyltransferase CheR [Sinorhizobium medicae]
MSGRAPSLKLAEQVAGRIGLSLPASRKRAVASAIDRMMVQRGIGEGRSLLARLGFDEDLTDEAISAVTVAETHFFRGPDQFQVIRQAILPELLRRRPDGSPLSIWSLGCATGEEPYSLAILCDEDDLLDDVRISAADVSRRALVTAREAEYGEWALRNTGPRLRQRYFDASGGRYRLNERLRRQVDFAHLNLGADALPSPQSGLADFDLILCRNVLVYFEASAVSRIAGQLLACLSDGGWLLTAPTDPPLWKYAAFETSITPAGVVYRRMARSKIQKNSTACTAPLRHQKRRPAAGRMLGRTSFDTPKAVGDDPAEAVTRQIRLLFDRGNPREAGRLAAHAIETHPLSAELHFLRGVSEMASGETDAAAAALRRVVYLDSNLAAAQFFLGVCLKHSDPKAALRALENALSSCLSRPPRERVALMCEATAEHLAQRAWREIGQLQRHLGSEAG